MSYQMISRFTLVLEKHHPVTGKTLRSSLIAKSVDRDQIVSELEGRAESWLVHHTLDNMEKSIREQGRAFACFPFGESSVFYVDGFERMA